MTYPSLYKDDTKTIDQIEYFNKLCKYSEVVLLNPKLVHIEGWKLSSVLIAYIREKFGLSKWSDSMEHDYSISLNDFEDVYQVVIR
jgi:hypothetical protein